MKTVADGCRIGFDLGASDFKISALKNGKVVFSKEFPWDPRNNADPEYHYSQLTAGLKEAAKALGRVDAIGGSTAGARPRTEPPSPGCAASATTATICTA